MKNTSIASAVLFIVFGLVLAPAYSEKMETMPTGMLAGIEGHNAAGKVMITKAMKGNPILTMTDIEVDKVPDGRVYLAKDGDYTQGIELGILRQFTGTVEFPIPDHVTPEDYDSVVIWCKKFDVGIGLAFFKKGMMK